MSCADHCGGEIPTERPAFFSGWAVRGSLAGWWFVAVGLLAQIFHWDALRIPAFALAILCASFWFAKEAVEVLIEEHEVGIELLMSIAILGAGALGQWREAALVACLYSITEALEGFTIQTTRWAIRGLMDTVPPTAHLLRNGEEIEVDVKEVKPGDQIRIRSGEAVSVDGVLREGRSSIDESSITGESIAVERGPGDKVVAGTLNGAGVLVVEATSRFEDNTVSRIIQLVERAQAQKGKVQLLVERFGRIYSPAVLAVTAGLIVVPMLMGKSTADWARKAVSFLVAASPCALAVSTPVTLVAAIGSGAKRGVLIKGGVILEALATARVVAFDKTGTLTHGQPRLTGVRARGVSEGEVLRLAAGVERQSEHPLALAVLGAAQSRGVEPAVATDVVALTGEGVSGSVEGRVVLVLKPESATARGIAAAPEEQAWLTEAQGRGETPVVVAADGVLLGLLAMADTVRPQAAGVVAALKQAGLTHVVMLTGDNAGTAAAIAAQVGITEFEAALSPAGKVEAVTRLRQQYGTTVMVGDGINDAPALATADVGIAMRTRGSDAALAAADVALMADDLTKLPEAVALARRARSIIKQNLVASGLIVLVLVAATLFGNLSMLAAVIGHEGSEVFIVLNGLRAALGRGPRSA